ncbi:MAG: 2-oxoacid:acceptor oxidoreductase family protein [Burkholderiaceae bacterium]|nr:2-oxoacid:acceptor oxidoreductase family protein [Burkholderiaceae bacterium]
MILVSWRCWRRWRSRGLDVKQSEVHGHGPSVGGTVFSHVRFGPQVWSPTIPQGEADLLVALEWAEGLRWLPYLKPQSGIFLCDTKRIVPPFACLNRRPGAMMRYSRETPAQMREHVALKAMIDATRMGRGARQQPERTANVSQGRRHRLISARPEWRAAIAQFVPERTLSINPEAFRPGREGSSGPDATGRSSLDEEAAARSTSPDVPGCCS